MPKWTFTAAVAVVAASCASLPRGDAAPTTVHFTSEHGKDVSVAVACGEGRPAYLGMVPQHGQGEFTIPAETTRCVWGLRFWLVPDGHPRGYMTDRIAVREGGHVEFFIEKYPALSAWSSR